MSDRADRMKMVSKLSTSTGRRSVFLSRRAREQQTCIRSSRQIRLEDSGSIPQASGSIETEEASSLANTRKTRILQRADRIEGNRECSRASIGSRFVAVERHVREATQSIRHPFAIGHKITATRRITCGYGSGHGRRSYRSHSTVSLLFARGKGTASTDQSG